MEFKTIETQEEFDAAIAERLKRQKETIEAKYQDYETIKEENNTLKTQLGESNQALEKTKKELEGYNSKIEELTGTVGQYELAKMKTTIALQNGIPFDLAARLQGDSEEAITEDAKNLAKLITQKEPTAPLKSTESSGNTDNPYKNLLEGLNI